MNEVTAALPAERMTSARRIDHPTLADSLLARKFQENGTELLRCLTDLCDQQAAQLVAEAAGASARVLEQQPQQQALTALFDKLRVERI